VPVYIYVLVKGVLMRIKVVLAIIIVLSVLGIVDAGYALNQHYAPPASSSCDFNETVSCTAVNQSEYSVLLGLPVAGLGIAGYALIVALSTAAIFVGFRWRRIFGWLLLALAAGALLFSLWLTWVEIFILKAVCPLCVISLTLIATITLLALLAVIMIAKTNQGTNPENGGAK